MRVPVRRQRNWERLFLGEIPLHIAIRENSDAGTPVVYSMPGSAYANAYLAVARQIKEKLGF